MYIQEFLLIKNCVIYSIKASYQLVHSHYVIHFNLSNKSIIFSLDVYIHLISYEL